MRYFWMGLVLGACVKDKPIEDSDPNGDDGGGDDGGTSDCADDVECSPWQICEAGDCLSGDRNNAADEAEPLPWEGAAEGYINPENDVDFYNFTADGGEYIQISTTTVEEEDDPYDTVLMLRKNANDKVVAIADEYATGTAVTGSDSVIYAYLDEPGDYTVSVEHAPAWDGSGKPYGAPDYTYTIGLSEHDGGTSEVDTFEDPGLTVTLGKAHSWISRGLLLEEPGDIDYVALDYSVEDAVLYIDGNEYVGGSDAVARVRLLDGEQEVYADLADVGPSGPAAYPNLPAGSYVIEVSDELGGGGPNHWVFVHAIARTDTTTLPEVEPNDQSLDATSLPLTEYQTSSGKDYSLGQAEGDLSTADEDWFLIDAPYEESWVIVCMSSSSYGSLVAPDIGVYDAGAELLAWEEGSATSYPNANLENVPLAPGNAYVRVAAPKDNAGGPGDWYRIRLYVASFKVSSFEDGGYYCP
jgi:hypothetical protein